jgi:hypothetical protein
MWMKRKMRGVKKMMLRKMRGVEWFLQDKPARSIVFYC